MRQAQWSRRHQNPRSLMGAQIRVIVSMVAAVVLMAPLACRPGETAKERITGELTPGTYGYACFLETKDGTPNAFLGMAGTFVVEEAER